MGRSTFRTRVLAALATGSPLPRVSGGADDSAASGDAGQGAGTAAAGAAADDGKPPAGAAGDGDSGKGGKEAVLADLAKERDRRQEAEAERDRLKKIEADYEKLRTASLSEQEKAIEEAKKSARDEALTEVNARVVRAEVKAIAGTKLNDPEDAARLLDLTKFSVDAQGNVDTKAISSAIDDLVKAKPYLAKNGKPSPLPGGGATPADGFSMDDWLRSQASGKGR